MTWRAAPLRPGGQRPALKQKPADRTTSEKYHTKSMSSVAAQMGRQDRSLREARAFGRDAFASCLGHRVRSMAARLTRSCLATCSTPGRRDRPRSHATMSADSRGRVWVRERRAAPSCGEIANRIERP